MDNAPAYRAGAIRRLGRPVHGGAVGRRIFRHRHADGLASDLVDDRAVLSVVGRDLRLTEHDDVLVDVAGALAGDAVGGDADRGFLAVDGEHAKARALAAVTGIATPASHQIAVGAGRRLLRECGGGGRPAAGAGGEYHGESLAIIGAERDVVEGNGRAIDLGEAAFGAPVMGVLELGARPEEVHDIEADFLFVADPIAFPLADQTALVVHPLVGGRDLVGAGGDDGHWIARRTILIKTLLPTRRRTAPGHDPETTGNNRIR